MLASGLGEVKSIATEPQFGELPGHEPDDATEHERPINLTKDAGDTNDADHCREYDEVTRTSGRVLRPNALVLGIGVDGHRQSVIGVLYLFGRNPSDDLKSA